jgi:hypothetical protein
VFFFIEDLYRGINEFMRGYQSRSDLMKDENGDLLADSHNILNRWKYFYQLFNVRRHNDIRQTEIHTAEPLVPDRRPFKVEIVTAKQKKHNHQAMIKFRQN